MQPTLGTLPEHLLGGSERLGHWAPKDTIRPYYIRPPSPAWETEQI